MPRSSSAPPLINLTRFWAILIILPIFVAWQASPLALLPVFGWRLDPTLVLAIAVGLLNGPRFGVLFGLVAGASQDLLVGAGLLYGATKALAGFTAGLIQPHIYRLDIVSLGMLGLVWTLGEGLLVAMYLMTQGRTAVWDHYAALSLPLGMAHAILLIVVYSFLGRLQGPEAHEERANYQ